MEPIPKLRPICLLKDIAKLFERVIARRMKNWMRESDEASLSDDQFGFVEGRSTCDTLLRLKDVAEAAFIGGGVVLAIGLNIENAFNFIPWPVIKQSMGGKEFPEYARRIEDSYLFARLGSIEYPTPNTQ